MAAVTDLVLLFHRNLSKRAFETVRFEDRVPSKGVLATRRNYLAIASSNKNDWLVTLAEAESKGALRICSFVFKA